MQPNCHVLRLIYGLAVTQGSRGSQAGYPGASMEILSTYPHTRRKRGRSLGAANTSKRLLLYKNPMKYLVASQVNGLTPTL